MNLILPVKSLAARRIAIAIAIIIPIAIVVAMMAAWLIRREARIDNDIKWYAEHGRIVARSLGAGFGTPYVRMDGSVLRNAGAVEGDIIDHAEHRIDDMIHRWLYQRQGQRVRWRLRAGGDGPALDRRPVKSIEFSVPKY